MRISVGDESESGSLLDPEELERWGSDRLARFKIPQQFRVAQSLPRTASGKLIRRSLTSLPPARR